jgi:hypothetical protein
VEQLRHDLAAAKRPRTESAIRYAETDAHGVHDARIGEGHHVG